MTEPHPTLAWETSSSAMHPAVSDRLPDEVATCLKNARFLHLATCTQNQPHVSLMNYTYLPPHLRPNPASNNDSHSQLPTGPTIIMTSNPSSKKTTNLVENPKVSLLVHDWTSNRPPNVTSGNGRERSPQGGRASSLANMLMQINTAAVSSISATINGEAHVMEPGTYEEKWCKEQHLANNTFEDTNELRQQRAMSSADIFGTSPLDGSAGDGGRGSYIEDDGVRVVVVRIQDGRISDWKGGVKDWVIREPSDGPLVNGISNDET